MERLSWQTIDHWQRFKDAAPALIDEILYDMFYCDEPGDPAQRDPEVVAKAEKIKTLVERMVDRCNSLDGFIETFKISSMPDALLDLITNLLTHYIKMLHEGGI